MWMNELWVVGFTGAVVAAALSWPLLGWSHGTSTVMSAHHRMLGVLLLLGAIAAALIATDHGQLASPRVAISLEHLVYAGDVLFWSLLTLWMRRATHMKLRTASTVAIVGMPLGLYAGLVSIFDGPPRFIWLLPLSVLGAGYAMTRALLTARDRGRSIDDRLVSRLAVFAVALCGAQTMRTFWPHVAMLREIVPLTLTAGFLSIASLAMRTVFSERSEAGTTEAAARTPYARSALDPASAAKLLNALAERMEKDRLYCDPQLSLATLAEEMTTTPHAISQALNQIDGRSLHEYLATWRVAEARRLLLDPATVAITIDALAEQAGFGSRSAFYKAFKATEGITPSEFRRRRVPPGGPDANG